jgi:hypothetical protein
MTALFIILLVCAMTIARTILFVVRKSKQIKKSKFIKLSRIGVNENGFLVYLEEKPQHVH